LENRTLKIRIAVLLLVCLALGIPAFAGALYTSGAIDGTTNALYIDGPGGTYTQTITNEFVATNSGTAASFNFGEWVLTGSTPASLTWSLGTSADASDIASGFTAQVSFALFISDNTYGYDVYTSTVSGLSSALIAGNTYYLTLGGAFGNFGNSALWDVNDGTSACYFAQGGTYLGSCGTGGEAFTIYGANGGVPEPGSIVLFGSGLLGLAALLRRKVSR
jgi:hypothetical protein